MHLAERQFAERITSIEPQTTRKVALLQALRSSGAVNCTRCDYVMVSPSGGDIVHTWSPGVGEHSLYCIGPDSFESTPGMSSWGVLTTTLNILDSRMRGFSGLAGPSQRLVSPARSREVGLAFDYRHTWFIPEAWERSSRYWWLSITVSVPEVWLFFPNVLSNGIELDATEPADNPVLKTLQNINPINHVVQAVYSIPRKSTLSLSGTLCDVVLNPRCRSMILFGASTGPCCPAKLKPKLRLCQRRGSCR